MKKIEDLKVKIFCDGANIEDFRSLGKMSFIKGYTTNPSLMRKAGVTDYGEFVREILPIIEKKPISFEVISDEFTEMKRQAVKLSQFAGNIYVKIPITNTRAESCVPLIKDLLGGGVKINVTAIMTLKQIEELIPALKSKTPAIVSVFAGRIADTGIDPIGFMKKAKMLLNELKNVELLWASPRELLNIFHAEEARCDIITVLPEILKKIHLVDYDLSKFSLDTVKMFHDDAKSSGLSL